jgi:hypothetical protein
MSPPRDVSETLDALERKLRELESELGAPPAAPGPPPAAGPAPPPPPPAGLDELARQIDDLGRFREQLLRIGRELEDEYARVLARLEGPAAAAVSAPPPPSVPDPDPDPVPEPERASGTLTVDAGPFADLGALAAFEQALVAVPAVTSAEVRGFEGRRAHLQVHLGEPVALEAELQVGIVRSVSEPGRLVLDLEDGS